MQMKIRLNPRIENNMLRLDKTEVQVFDLYASLSSWVAVEPEELETLIAFAAKAGWHVSIEQQRVDVLQSPPVAEPMAVPA